MAEWWLRVVEEQEATDQFYLDGGVRDEGRVAGWDGSGVVAGLGD